MTIKCPKCHSENPETKQFCADCGTQLPPPQDKPPVATETFQTPVRELTTGSTFAGRYQVIEELGQGGMGKVYKVFDTDIKEKIALKLLRPEIALEKDEAKRYQTAEELRTDLEKVEQGLPTTDRILPTKKGHASKEITVKFDVRRILVPALIVLVLAVAAALLWRTISRKEAVPTAQRSSLLV